MTSTEIFKQNRYLKQLIQQEQLLERLYSPFAINVLMPPSLITGDHPIEERHQCTLSEMQHPALLPYQGVDTNNQSSLSYPQPKPLDWPKSRKAEDVQFRNILGYDPNKLLFHDLSELGIANRISGQVKNGYISDVTPIYQGISSAPSHFKLSKSLKDRLIFRQHEIENFRNYNRYW